MALIIISRLYFQLIVAVFILFVSSCYMLQSFFTNASRTSWIFQSWRLLLAIICMGLSSAYCWALRERPSAIMTFRQLTGILFMRLLCWTLLKYRFVRPVEASWKTPRQHQERLLMEIAGENGDTEYCRRFNLKTVQSLAEYRKRLPLTTYDQYRDYVERMMEGDDVNVLTKRKPSCYVRTSGTTGQSKYYPYVSRTGLLARCSLCMKAYVAKNYPSTDRLKRALFFYVHPIVSEAKSGTIIETIATMSDAPQFVLDEYVTPLAGFRIHSIRDAYYIHFLFGLRDPDVACINIGFMTFLECALNQLKEQWRDLVKDVETGTINPSVKLPVEVRAALTAALAGKGYPQRARQLRQEFEKGFDGILKRIWPSLVVVTAIDHTRLWPKLERTFTKGVSYMQSGYGSSEGFIAANVGKMCRGYEGVGYVPFPTVVIVEFINVDDIYQSQPKTYFMDEVDVGQCYELVLTQADSGLYRYRFGDVVKVIGFHDNCPVIEFAFRIGQMLNLHYEKVDQQVVDDAIRAAVARWPGRHLFDFTVAESTLVPDESRGQFIDGDVPYYIFFIGLYGDTEDDVQIKLADEEKKMVDEELRRRNGDYDRLRREGSISHPRVKSVRAESFSVLQTFILENTNALQTQYKSPRKLRLFEMFRLMMEQAL